MNYKLWYDAERKIIYLKTFKTMTAEDVHQLMAQAAEEFEGKEADFSLIDMTDAGTEHLGKDTRDAFKQYADSLEYKKIAIVGANPVTRMLARVALAVTGKSKIARFFKTEAQALEWLKGKTKR